MEMEALVWWLNKLHFCLILSCLTVFHLAAAEYSNNQLKLEINLASSPSMSIKTNGSVQVCEADGLICRYLAGSFQVSLVNQDEITWYGILDKKLSWIDPETDSLAVPREYFTWENGKLTIKREYLKFLVQSFSSKSEAENYALSKGFSASKVMEIPVVNSTVQIITAHGDKYYMETPLRISSDKAIQINGESLGFEGEFILKSVKGRIVLNHFLGLEAYLAGVVQNEIGNNSPTEALKAQAVAARTHALSLLANNRHKADGFDLCSSTHCQVYKGKYLQNDALLKAIADCEDEALFISGQIADATYHSSCGGKTDASSAVWKGKPVAHLNGVSCWPEVDSLDLSLEPQARLWIDTRPSTNGMSSWERGALNWEKTITRSQLAKNAGLTTLKRIEINQRGRSGRIMSLKLIGDKTLSLDNEYKIRQVFGNLLSSFFYIKGSYRQNGNATILIPRATLTIKGKGAGHGVGMCQVGALRLARDGMSYQYILQYYYPGTTISREWKDE